MKKYILLSLFGLATIGYLSAQADWKELKEDPQINFYTVCDSAEAFFNTIDKEAKGSGWKGYQRWKEANEYKYFPDGNRSKEDPFFVQKAFEQFLNTLPPRPESLYNGIWKDLGPYSIDSITGHYAAGLGRVEDIYVHPSDTNRIYQASRSGGFWRSSDGGQTWLGNSTDFLVASGVNTITASPTNADSVLINVQNAQNGYSHGIYRSIDGGASWTLTDFDPVNVGFGGLGSNFKINEIAYHPRVPDLVIVGTNKGLYRSDDNLVTWTRSYNGNTIKEITFHPTIDSIIYIYNTSNTYRNQVLRSTDLGVSYDTSSTIPGNNNNTTVEMVSSPACPSCLWFASNNGVWFSGDTGRNFVFRTNPGQSCHGFAVSDLDTNYVFYGYVDGEASSDGGNSFNQVTYWSLSNTNGAGSGNQTSYRTSTNYIHADLRNARALNGSYYVTTDGFISKSTDNGATWTNIGNGVGIRENYRMGLSQSNHYRSVSGSQDNGTSFLTEGGWIEFYGADGMEAIMHPLNEDWFISSLQYGGRRKTKTAGQTQNGVTPSGSSNADWISPLAFNPNHHMTVYDFRDQVYRSDDFGDSYTVIGAPNGFTGNIKHAVIAENNDSIIVIARNNNIEKSTDGGATFSSIRNNLPNHNIEGIAIDPRDDETMVVIYARYQADSQKVYLTTDGGANWQNITWNLGNLPIRSVIIDHTPERNIYVGAEIGIYVKPMADSVWQQHGSGLPNMSVRDLEINYGSNTIKAATWGRGIWEYSLKDREDHPAIVYTTITNPPTETTPKESVDQFVRTRIHYDSTLSSVFVRWSADSLSFDQSISMSYVSDSTWLADSALPNLPTGTKLYFKVFAVGANADTSETYKFMYEVQPFSYCDASGNNSAGNLFLDLVELETLSNVSGNANYTLYNVPVVELIEGGTHVISASANTGWSSNDYAAWIDYNGDRDFSADEQVMLAIGAGANGIDTFTVPFGVNTGDTLAMRVRLSYWGTTPLACGDQYGEVEDYRVTILPADSLLVDISSPICIGDEATIELSGAQVDSVNWMLISGSDTISSVRLLDTVTPPAIGMYDLILYSYRNGSSTLQSVSAALVVGGDYFTSLSDSICRGDNYQLPDGFIIPNVTANRIDTVRLFSSLGCDSIISVNLRIRQVGASVTSNGLQLSAPVGASSYQWIDCDNGSDIAGATSNTYTATQSGNFAVRMNRSGCDSTSSCVNVVLSSLELLKEEGFRVYPKPASGKFTVEYPADAEDGSVVLYDLNGRLLQAENAGAGSRIDFGADLPAATYLLMIRSGNLIFLDRIPLMH